MDSGPRLPFVLVKFLNFDTFYQMYKDNDSNTYFLTGLLWRLNTLKNICICIKPGKYTYFVYCCYKCSYSFLLFK